MAVPYKSAARVRLVKRAGERQPASDDAVEQVQPGELLEQRLAQVHHSMLDGLGQLADYFGFGKVMGQIYGAMLLSSRPLCLDDLVESLDISKANASINMRTLENMGMVREVWVRGGSGRRKFYEAETDFWQIITNILKGREMRDVERAISVMDENVRQLNEAVARMQAGGQGEKDQRAVAEAGLYIERIAQMQMLFQFAQMSIFTILARAAESGVEAGLSVGAGAAGSNPADVATQDSEVASSSA